MDRYFIPEALEEELRREEELEKGVRDLLGGDEF